MQTNVNLRLNSKNISTIPDPVLQTTRIAPRQVLTLQPFLQQQLPRLLLLPQIPRYGPLSGTLQLQRPSPRRIFPGGSLPI